MNLIQAKICLLGDFAVGKTSLVRRAVEGRFDDRYLSTIGVKISRKSILRPGYTLNLILWDLAGSETFSHTQSTYISGAQGALIVCDLTRIDTLVGLSQYVDLIKNHNPGAAVIFAANKVDLLNERRISDDDLNCACKQNGSVFLTSAKTGEGIEEALLALAGMIEIHHGLRYIE